MNPPGARSPRGCLVFVSDDGSRADLEKLGPLARDGVPFTLSLVRDFLEGNARKGTQMTPADVDQMVSWGCEVAAHGLTHRPLAGMDEAEMEDEVDGSIDYLKSRGWEVPAFVYPFGSCNTSVRRKIMRAGLAGCLTHGGIAAGPWEMTSIPRIAFGSFQRPLQSSFRFYQNMMSRALNKRLPLVLMLHPEEPSHGTEQQDLLVKLVQHAAEIGLPVKRLGDAVAERRPQWQEHPGAIFQRSINPYGQNEILWTGGSIRNALCNCVFRDSPLAPLIWKTRGRLRKLAGRTGMYGKSR